MALLHTKFHASEQNDRANDSANDRALDHALIEILLSKIKGEISMWKTVGLEFCGSTTTNFKK